MLLVEIFRCVPDIDSPYAGEIDKVTVHSPREVSRTWSVVQLSEVVVSEDEISLTVFSEVLIGSELSSVSLQLTIRTVHKGNRTSVTAIFLR